MLHDPLETFQVVAAGVVGLLIVAGLLFALRPQLAVDDVHPSVHRHDQACTWATT